jgi:AcrR family transcriptional regulator
MSSTGFAGARASRTVPRMAPAAAHRTDRRVDRTRAALMRAFVDLMLSQELETITVGSIVERANVGRSTFYTHFRGRQDILKASLEFPSLPLARAATEDVGEDSLLGLLAHFRQQRRLARAFTSGAMRQLWVHRLAELIEPRLAALARRPPARPLLPSSLAALAIAELQIGFIVHWLASHAPPSPEATADALIAASRGVVSALLGAPPR